MVLSPGLGLGPVSDEGLEVVGELIGDDLLDPSRPWERNSAASAATRVWV